MTASQSASTSSARSARAARDERLAYYDIKVGF
jgi:hypothetical protein